MLPATVDFAQRAGCAEHQVWVDPEQAVASAGVAAFDRFEQEVAAFGLDQLECRADRGLGIGDQPAPDEGGPALAERRARLFGIFWKCARQMLIP
jgi:hypothetical protein